MVGRMSNYLSSKCGMQQLQFFKVTAQSELQQRCAKQKTMSAVAFSLPLQQKIIALTTLPLILVAMMMMNMLV
jgi:hypothetical protein